MSLDGIVSKRADAAYAPGNRGLWLKVKCLHREEICSRRLGPIPKARSAELWAASDCCEAMSLNFALKVGWLRRSVST
jgi:hypothetical protein